MQEFDFIVVGAGSAGCVVAARLSESGSYTVALIEAGGEDDSFWIHTPLGYGKLYDHPRYNWLYESEPEAELANTKSYQPRGKVLGGTGAINGMVYMRGQREDYDYWRQLGNVGWGYDDVLPFFKKTEDNCRGAGVFHGVGGPVGVVDMPHTALGDAFLDSVQACGLPMNDDANGASHEGFGYTQFTARKGRRSNSAVAFLHPARRRSNLKVLVNALATRIVIENGIAVGVDYVRNGAKETLRARREVIICGGTFNSPQILQVSGVGPAPLLQELGIKVVSDLRGVGENLQDHFGVGTTYRCTRPVTVNDAVNNPFRRWSMGLRYILSRTGMMATNATLCIGYLRTDPSLAAPDSGIVLTGWCRAASGRSKEGLGLAKFSGFTVSALLLHPNSRGSVRIKSADAQVAPEIRFNFFKTERDRNVMATTLGTIRRIMATEPISSYVAEEIAPGRVVVSDEGLIDFCRRYGRSTHHATSSCKMGVDEMAVLDPRLRVRGVDRLRVMDGSIMPAIVAGNPNAPIMMIAEKGAAMVLEDARNALCSSRRAESLRVAAG